MSPFAAIFDASGQPLGPDVVEALGLALDGIAGSEGCEVSLPAPVIAFGRGKAPPIDSQQRQPAQGTCLGAESLVVGQLSEALDMGGGASTADLLLRGLKRFGPDFWLRLPEPFGIALFDSRRNVLSLARSPLGGRTLFYSEIDGLLLVADEIEALLGWRGRRPALDTDQVARFFGLEQPTPGRTFFEGVQEVPPGVVIEFGSAGQNERQFWVLDPSKRSTVAPDDVFAERFRSLLMEETGNLCAEPERLGVMLSGGIDSTSLAVLGAQQLAEGGEKLAACSWTFDDLRSCDERSRIAQTLAAHDFEVIQISGDDLWPLCDLALFSTLPGTPDENPYRALKQGLYSAASARGRSVLLNGGFADIFYRGGRGYFRDLVRDGQWWTALRSLGREMGDSGLRSAAGSVGRLAFPAGRRRATRSAPKWLTPEAGRRWCKGGEAELPAERGLRDVIPYLAMEARGLAIETRYAAQDGVEVASPYWTREWIDFMLSLPAHQVFRPGCTKYVARQAMRGIIPESVRVAQEPTLLDPLFDRGLFERETSVVHDLLYGGNPVWQAFVQRGLVDSVQPGSSPAHKVVLWQCVSFELWRRKHGWELS